MVLHLLYARFGINSYMILAWFLPKNLSKNYTKGMILGENNEKMSKSRGNVVNPDDVVAKYGADTLRLYEMFIH